MSDLLDVSRIVTGKLQLTHKPVDLIPVTAAAVEALRPAATEKGVTLESDLDPATGTVLGDAERLQQVIGNLLANAVKFTPAGGHVRVCLARAGGEACVSVTDTGVGIAADFLPYVFDRFRQADSSSTRGHSGLGLGLAIVRSIVDLHRGRVTAESEGQGQGATFTVRLPLLTPPRTGDAGAAPQRVEGRPAETALAGVRVLVVEDAADTRGFLTLLLEGEGATVTTAASSAEALAALQASPVDVLLTDIAMPGEDGYALIARVRAHDNARGVRLPALALTAYAGPADRAYALAAGFDEHLAKPVEPAALIAALVRLAGRSGAGTGAV